MRKEVAKVTGAARTADAPGRGSDRASVGALLVYALAVAFVVAAPVLRRLYLPPGSRYQAGTAANSHLSDAAAVDELVIAPPFHTSQPERTPHISRTWGIVGGVGVNVVTVNPKAENVKVVLGLAQGTVLSQNRFGREDFGPMVRRLKPRVAINGTYFNLRNNEPVGALVMEGRLIYDGLSSGVLMVSEEGQVWIEYHQGKFGRNLGWARNIRTAVGAGPMLLQSGKVALRPRDEGFGDPSLFALARRSAVGVTAEGKLLLVTVETPISLNKLAFIMLRLGAVNAMALDGGGSTALYSNGQFISLPGRPLTNLILVYD